MGETQTLPEPMQLRWFPLLRLAGRLLWSAGSDLSFAAFFLVTWIAPYTFGEHTVRRLLLVMLLEFLVVHSTGFLGAIGAADSPLRVRALQYGGLLLFYLIFALAFAAGMGSLWPVVAFVLLLLSKLPVVVLRPPTMDGQMVVMANWAAMTALYLGGIFLTVTANVPALGITPEVIAHQEIDVGGIWPEEPYRVMAFGTIYFTGLAIQSMLNEVIPFLWKRKEGARA